MGARDNKRKGELIYEQLDPRDKPTAVSLWLQPKGVYNLMSSLADYEDKYVGKRFARQNTFVNSHDSLIEILCRLTPLQLESMYVSFRRAVDEKEKKPLWAALDCFHYIQLTWFMLHYLEYQTVIVLKKDVGDDEETQVTELYKHARAIADQAKAVGVPLLWVMEDDYADSKGTGGKLHVHVYVGGYDSVGFLRSLRKKGSLIEQGFVPTKTHLIGTRKILKPQFNMRPLNLDPKAKPIVMWPIMTKANVETGEEDAAIMNTLKYAISKVLGWEVPIYSDTRRGLSKNRNATRMSKLVFKYLYKSKYRAVRHYGWVTPYSVKLVYPMVSPRKLAKAEPSALSKIKALAKRR